MPDSASSEKRPVAAERPFPWRCRRCAKPRVFPTLIDYDVEVRHDGRLHAFVVRSLNIPVCQECGNKVFTEVVDSQITDALFTHLRNCACDFDAAERRG